MSIFKEIEEIIPSMEVKKTYTDPHKDIIFNVPETYFSGISKEMFSDHIMGYNKLPLPIAIPIILIPKTNKDNYDKMSTIVKWLIKKPKLYNINNYSTPLDIVTDVNTQEDICLNTDNCFLKFPEDFSGDDVPKSSFYRRFQYHKKIKKCLSKKSNF